MMHFFTSINLNYLPKARVLAASVKRHHPEAQFTLVLCERRESVKAKLDADLFDQVLYVEDLHIPVDNLPAWIFQHSVVELCTAVKPFACREIFLRGAEQTVVYLDPDIQVFDSLDFLESELLDHGVLLTPHMLAAAPDRQEIELHEISCLRHGTFNLGFFAFERNRGKATLDWWCERLRDYCHDDIPRGLFTDQRWMDLAPSLFAEVKILRDETCNVASWNVSRRTVSRSSTNTYLCNDRPLRFFHFSGFDSGTHDRVIALVQPGNAALQTLTEEYRAALSAVGQSELAGYPWSYGRFENGHAIEATCRRIYRREPELQRRFADPYATGADGGYYHWSRMHLKPLLPPLVVKAARVGVRALQRISLRCRVALGG